MTVVNEQKDSKKYDRIELCEFCELICRCAESKFKGSGLTNSQMVEVMLDELFTLTGFQRREVSVQRDEQSESDDEY